MALTLVYTLVMVVQVYSPQLVVVVSITVLVAQEVRATHQVLMVTMVQALQMQLIEDMAEQLTHQLTVVQES